MAHAIRQAAPWWLWPTSVALSLGGFSLYAIWAALQMQGAYQNYLSPLYALKIPSPWAWLSPAILTIWVPIGFRASCYYFRKAYYRALFWDPPACARKELRSNFYSGEMRFPFVLNNLHRYFLYFALFFTVFHWYDTVHAFIFDGQFGIRLGSLLFLADVVFLSLYVFSCHSLRHLLGGSLDCYTCSRSSRARHGLWRGISTLNEQHGLWGWVSLFTILAVDIYIRLLQAGVITDVKFL